MFGIHPVLAVWSVQEILRTLGIWATVLAWFAGVSFFVLLFCWLTLRHIPNNAVGIIEKMWAGKGSVGEGAIIALDGQAGWQAEVLRGGIHFGYWRWQYAIHRVPLITIAQGKIGYVYSRDGEPLPPNQTLARVVECQDFQAAREFLLETPEHQRGQRGRQRAILREGVYAINLALFVVITEDAVFALDSVSSRQERQLISGWRDQLSSIRGFHPVVVGLPIEAPNPLDHETRMQVDSIGLVTVHDGLSLKPGEIIAPSVGSDPSDENYHNNYQDPEAFLRAGGKRGRQYVPLTDGT